MFDLGNFINLNLKDSKNPYFEIDPTSRHYIGVTNDWLDPFYQIQRDCKGGVLIQGKKIQGDDVETTLINLLGDEKRAKNVGRAFSQNLEQQIRYPVEMPLQKQNKILTLDFFYRNLLLSKSNKFCFWTAAKDFGVSECDIDGLVKNDGKPSYYIPGIVLYCYVYHEDDQRFHLERSMASNILLQSMIESGDVPSIEQCALYSKECDRAIQKMESLSKALETGLFEVKKLQTFLEESLNDSLLEGDVKKTNLYGCKLSAIRDLTAEIHEIRKDVNKSLTNKSSITAKTFAKCDEKLEIAMQKALIKTSLHSSPISELIYNKINQIWSNIKYTLSSSENTNRLYKNSFLLKTKSHSALENIYHHMSSPGLPERH